MRLLLLSSKLGYQFRGFAEAAKRIGAEVLIGSDRCHQLEDPWRDGALPVHFEQPEEAARALVEAARQRPVHGILALGDRPTETAARVAGQLGIPYNPVASVANCRSKIRQREVLRDAGLPVPKFFSFSVNDAGKGAHTGAPLQDLDRVLRQVEFPCVVKPHKLYASTGVIRANNASEFRAAVDLIRRVLASPEVLQLREPDMDQLLVESYIPGGEVAVEGLLTNGELRVLAIFDKPDPLTGPYFEETIYVTPSRLPAYAQIELKECLRRCVAALGLTHGPLHAEFRVNEQGPWMLEVQPRPIGGLCSRALRFVGLEDRRQEKDDAEAQRTPRDAEKNEGDAEAQRIQKGAEKPTIFLEELLVRHALGLEGSDLPRERAASGVMMIPVPHSGTLERVHGVDEARAVPGIVEFEITARLHDYVAAWPEGSSYLGFIFARGAEPEEVEAALRQAHSKLHFTLTPRLPVEHPVTKRLTH